MRALPDDGDAGPTLPTTCRGDGCPMACYWRGHRPTGPYDQPPGGTWGGRREDGLWSCAKHLADLRPRKGVHDASRR